MWHSRVIYVGRRTHENVICNISKEHGNQWGQTWMIKYHRFIIFVRRHYYGAYSYDVQCPIYSTIVVKLSVRAKRIYRQRVG